MNSTADRTSTVLTQNAPMWNSYSNKVNFCWYQISCVKNRWLNTDSLFYRRIRR